MVDLNHNNRTLATTNLRHAKTVTVEGITLDVPENCPAVAVQRRLDGKWYCESQVGCAAHENLIEAVRLSMGG